MEWQFDRSKVFLTFSASQRVDFRDFMKAISALCGAPAKMVRFNESYGFAPREFTSTQC